MTFDKLYDKTMQIYLITILRPTVEFDPFILGTWQHTYLGELKNSAYFLKVMGGP